MRFVLVVAVIAALVLPFSAEAASFTDSLLCQYDGQQYVNCTWQAPETGVSVVYTVAISVSGAGGPFDAADNSPVYDPAIRFDVYAYTTPDALADLYVRVSARRVSDNFWYGMTTAQVQAASEPTPEPTPVPTLTPTYIPQVLVTPTTVPTPDSMPVSNEQVLTELRDVQRQSYRWQVFAGALGVGVLVLIFMRVRV